MLLRCYELRVEVLPVADPVLAVPDPALYRYAVHCCSFKFDLGSYPDHAIALFAQEDMAKIYGARMWPGTFQVVDLLAKKEASV